MDKTQTIAFITKAIDMENKIVAIVEQNTAKLGHVFVRDLLLAISQDSKKHAALLKSLSEAVKGPTPFITQHERDAIAKGIEEHIKLEAKAVETYAELAQKSDSQQVKIIAQMIREDEIRHHALLKELHKTVIEPETLTEDIIYELIWKDAPWHGTPGG